MTNFVRTRRDTSLQFNERECLFNFHPHFQLPISEVLENFIGEKTDKYALVQAGNVNGCFVILKNKFIFFRE